jgi:hypothetical protein
VPSQNLYHSASNKVHGSIPQFRPWRSVRRTWHLRCRGPGAYAPLCFPLDGRCQTPTRIELGIELAPHLRTTKWVRPVDNLLALSASVPACRRILANTTLTAVPAPRVAHDLTRTHRWRDGQDVIPRPTSRRPSTQNLTWRAFLPDFRTAWSLHPPGERGTGQNPISARPPVLMSAHHRNTRQDPILPPTQPRKLSGHQRQ